MVQQSLQIFKILKMVIFSKTTYFKHQCKYLEPTVIDVWRADQERNLAEVSQLEGGLVLAGDGRCDSPGFCAKYLSYSVIECRSNKVLDVQLVQSNEMQNTPQCELEGLKRCLQFLEDKGHAVDSLITDRHLSIAKWVREQRPEIKHMNDVWHGARGLGKKLDAISKKYPDVGGWKKSIINHMYWTASSTEDGHSDIMEAKWVSVLDHVIDKHENCYHDDLEGEDRCKAWLDMETKQYSELESIILHKNVVKDVRKLSPRYQTSHLEAFHSLMIRFAPKHTAYSYLGMMCRVLLAALHFNENCNKKQAQTKDGQDRWGVTYRKFKGGACSVRKIREEATYGYTTTLVGTLLDKYLASPSDLKTSINELRAAVPGPLASRFVKMDKDSVIQDYESRFSDLTLS